MGSRVFNTVVVGTWLSTMSWLLVAKVLPPLWVGDPPNYRTIVTADAQQKLPPDCWKIEWNDRLLGWAISDMTHKDGVAEIYNRVYFSELPIADMVSPFIGNLIKPILNKTGEIDLDARSRTLIDPFGRMSSFDSYLRLGELRDAIKIKGSVDGSKLSLRLKMGELHSETERYLPPDALMGDELAPQSRLPGLRVGQTWTMPVYSPLRPNNEPMEILQSTVERTDFIIWNDETVETHVVVYRNDSGVALMAGGKPRGSLWVRGDGIVLVQEVTMGQSRIRFERLPDELSERVAKAVGDPWRAGLSSDQGNDILSLVADKP